MVRVSVSEVNNSVHRFFEAGRRCSRWAAPWGRPCLTGEEHQVDEGPQGQEGALWSCSISPRTPAGPPARHGWYARWFDSSVVYPAAPRTKLPYLSKLKLPKE